jgi:hypothetical protein
MYITSSYRYIPIQTQRADLYLGVMGCLAFWKSTEISRDACVFIERLQESGYKRTQVNSEILSLSFPNVPIYLCLSILSIYLSYKLYFLPRKIHEH